MAIPAGHALYLEGADGARFQVAWGGDEALENTG